VLSPPESLLLDCKPAPPPNREDFLAASVDRKLELLGLAYMAQTTVVKLCNADKLGVRVWIVKTTNDIAQQKGEVVP